MAQDQNNLNGCKIPSSVWELLHNSDDNKTENRIGLATENPVLPMERAKQNWQVRILTIALGIAHNHEKAANWTSASQHIGAATNLHEGPPLAFRLPMKLFSGRLQREPTVLLMDGQCTERFEEGVARVEISSRASPGEIVNTTPQT